MKLELLASSKSKLLLSGSTIQIDPTFPYYLNRSEESIAEELDWAGYRCVRYFVTNEKKVSGSLIKAFHARGISVWAMILGNGAYQTEGFPPEWRNWQMKLLKPTQDGYVRFSPFCRDYVKWKKITLVQMLKEHPFDGLEIAEPYMPEWNGLRSGVYGDLSEHAVTAFRERYGCPIPDFGNRFNRFYYRRNRSLYAKWMQLRTDAVNEYVNEIFNGVGGIRCEMPSLKVATWTLAVDAGAKSPSLLREYQGNDAVSMIGRVKPDLHFLQTHWPDWQKPELPPDYAKQYYLFMEEIRKAHPNIPLGIQADIGSLEVVRRDRQWMNRFAKTVSSLGYSTWAAYEYHLGKSMYEDRPAILTARQVAEDQIRISFNKRIDERSVSQSEQYRIIKNGAEYPLECRQIRVDGNRIFIRAYHLPQEPFLISVMHVKDTPELWFCKGYKANEAAGPCITSVKSCFS